MPFLSYWHDLEADFLRFYHIDINETGVVEAARFFRLAARVAVYDGMLASRVREEQEKNSKKFGANSGEVREVPVEALATMESGIIDFK